MNTFFKETLKLSENRRKWMHEATKEQFDEQINKVRGIAVLADTLLILHFSGHGLNNCTAEGYFGDDEIVSIQDAAN
jgi:hypothetical protein